MELITTTTFPGDDVSPAQIEAAARTIRSVGTTVARQGATVLTTWQTLSASYDAPEAPKLLAAMNPVKPSAEDFGKDLGTAATALETYADDARTIKQTLVGIRAEANTFRDSVASGVEQAVYQSAGQTGTKTVDWKDDPPTVMRNNELIGQVDAQARLLEAAQATCAAAINALTWHAPWKTGHPPEPPGPPTPHPWGTQENYELCSDPIGHGFTEAATSNLVGLLALFGRTNPTIDPNDINRTIDLGQTSAYDPKLAQESWSNIAHLMAFGSLSLTLSGAPGPLGDHARQSNEAALAFLKGMTAADVWSQDPGKAGGMVLFNLVTLGLAASKGGLLGKAATPEALAAREAAIARIGEKAAPLGTVLKAADRLGLVAGPELRLLDRVVNGKPSIHVDLRGLDLEVPEVPRRNVDLDHGNTPAVPEPPTPRTPTGPTTHPVGPGHIPITGGPDPLPAPLAHRPFEDLHHPYGPGVDRIDATHPATAWNTTSPNRLGEIGEQLTRRDLSDRGFRIVAEQAEIRIPQTSRYFKPDFIAYDPVTKELVLVESKMNKGARFTPNQLDGYAAYAHGADDLTGRSLNTNQALRDALRQQGITTRRVSRVEVYRWNTEIIPSAGLRSRAGVP